MTGPNLSTNVYEDSGGRGISVSGNPASAAGDKNIAAWGVGAGLTSQQLSDLRDAIETYMVARGI